MTKFVRYKVKLKSSNPDLLLFLKPFIQKRQGNDLSLSEARELRRALATVFGGDAARTGPVRLEIMSVGASARAKVRKL